MSRTEDGLYQALEKELKGSQEPLSCAELYERMSIREYASSVNRVSDYLGNLWRRGDVVRLPAPRGITSRARWLYTWKGRKVVKPDKSTAIDFGAKKLLLQRPSLEISEAGANITIEMPHFVITIKQR